VTALFLLLGEVYNQKYPFQVQVIYILSNMLLSDKYKKRIKEFCETNKIFSNKGGSEIVKAKNNLRCNIKLSKHL
jgi:hypothetical protein